jgi:Icc-related predicted phosphoesterase
MNQNNKTDYFEQYCKNYKYLPTVLPKARRIVAIGDIHGDYRLCIKLLKIAQVIDNNLNWIGGDTIVVQVGDQIDRCRPYNGKNCSLQETTLDDEHSDIKILKFFTKLDKIAQKNVPPGKVISLLGNHELLNVQGYFNYVSYEGISKFDNYKDPSNPNLLFESGQEARKYSFRPGNEYSKFLACTRLGAVIIGSNLFVHAGIIDHFIKQLNLENVNDLEDINIKIQKWLLGLIDKKYVDDIINGTQYSMFWNRILGNLPKDVSLKDPRCANYITEALRIFNVDSMIIGHTPQSFINNDKINSTCSNKVWRVDNGSSKAFNIFDHEYIKTGKITDSRKPQVLEILNDDTFNVLM